MVTNKTYEYGIKYKIHKINEYSYLLLPFSLEGGLSDGFVFSLDNGTIPICNVESDLRRKYIMDNVYETEELEEMYEIYDDTDAVAKKFYEEYSKYLIYIVVDKENKRLKKYYLDLESFIEQEYDFTYYMDKGAPVMAINESAANEIMQAEDMHAVKVLLQKYKKHLESFKEMNERQGTSRLEVSDASLDEFDGEHEVRSSSSSPSNSKKTFLINPDLSYVGLRDYIKESVFGHDEEIKLIAQKLFMNYSAVDGEDVESILIVGPSGTGKTQTVTAACEYLGVPHFEVNTANIVPEGIRGTSVEDIIISLYRDSGYDLPVAQKGLVFFDEYEKLCDSDLNIKTLVKHIMLTFNDGGKIPIRTEKYDFTFDSKMTTKLYAGVFEKLFQRKKVMGFGADVDGKPEIVRDTEGIKKKIIDAKYYTNEDISRINNAVYYDELTRETKRQILLHSKLSELAKKKKRYKRQFGIDIEVSEDFVDAILESISNNAEGMRNVNNFVSSRINLAEQSILEDTKKGYKRLVLSKRTVEDPTKFDLS